LITRFEEIQAWQEARKLVKMIYKLTNSGMSAKDEGLRDQIQRAAVSSMTNIEKDLIASLKQNLRVFLASSGGLLWKFNHYFTRTSILNM